MKHLRYLTAFSVFGLLMGVTPPIYAITVNENTSFSTRFVGEINGGDPQGSDDSGDGLTFMLQNDNDGQPDGANALGDQGGNIGAYSISGNDAINNSVIVEFDTFLNDRSSISDPNDNHIGLNLDGDAKSETTAEPGFNLNDDSSDSSFTAWIDYDGSNDEIDVFVANGNTNTKPDTPVLQDTVNLFDQTGSSAFVGFSAGTGEDTNEHLIQEFEFNSGTTNITGVSYFNSLNGSANLQNNGSTLQLTPNSTDQRGSAFRAVPFEAESTMGLVALGGYLFYRYRKKRKQALNQ